MANAFQNDPATSLLESLAGYQYLTNIGLSPAAAAQSTGVPTDAVNAFNLNGAGSFGLNSGGGSAFGGYGYGQSPSASGFGFGGILGGIASAFGIGQQATPAANVSTSSVAPTASQAATSATNASPADADAFGTPSSISESAPASPSSVSTGMSGFSPTDFGAMQNNPDIAGVQLGVNPDPASIGLMSELGLSPTEATGTPSAPSSSTSMSGSPSAADYGDTGSPAAPTAAQGFSPAEFGAMQSAQNDHSNVAAATAFSAAQAMADADFADAAASMPSAAPASTAAPSSQSNLGMGQQAPTATAFGVDMSGKFSPDSLNDQMSEDDALGTANATTPSNGMTGVTSANPAQNEAMAIGTAFGKDFGTAPSAPSTAQAPSLSEGPDSPFGGISAGPSAAPPGMSNLGMAPSSMSADFGTDDNGPSDIGGFGTFGGIGGANAFGTAAADGPSDIGGFGDFGGVSSAGSMGADAFGGPSGENGASAPGTEGFGGSNGFGGASDVGVSDNGTDFGGVGDVGGFGGVGGGYGGPGDGSGDASV